MGAAEYMKRAMARLQARGWRNTAVYSTHVVAERVRGAVLDLRYGGKPCLTDLKTNGRDAHRHTMVHSDYHALRTLFARVPITRRDVLVDVGCGEGRVINFWLSEGLTNPMVGLEGHKPVAERARRRYRRYPNVTIIHGDAVDNLPRSGTIFYLYNPFSEQTMARFAAALAGIDATIVYYIDNHLEPFRDGSWTIRDLGYNDGIVEYRASLITRRRSP